MLEIVDREYVKGLLVAQVSIVASPRQEIIANLPPDIAGLVLEGLAPVNLVEHVLVLCERDGWQRRPTAMAALLIGILGNIDRVPAILAKLATQPAAAALAPDPFDTFVLDNGLPFLDRRETRNVLKTWTQLMPIKQVMVVEGRSQTGKTYTHEFVRHLVRHVTRAAFDLRTALVTLERDQAPSVGQVELASELMAEMGVFSPPPPPDTNTAAWTKQLVRWVLAEANRQGLRWWFVLDGFRSSYPGEAPQWQLREDTREFIVAFVKALTNGINVTRHRLLLLDFDRSILPLKPSDVGIDKTSSIPMMSIRGLIRSIIYASGKPLNPDEIEVEIMNGLGDPVENLTELNARLVDLLEIA